jgi:hypothetical protein
MATSDEKRTCPTCGEDGPDSVDVDYEGGVEMACGDEWHDDAEMLAAMQDDLARCLVALGECVDSLWTVMQESEHGRFGRPGYDTTLDHLWEVAQPAYELARQAVNASPQESTDG